MGAFPTHLTHTLHRTGQFLQDDAGDEVVRAIRERWASPPRFVHNQTITLLSMDWDATDAQTATVLTTSNQY